MTLQVGVIGAGLMGTTHVRTLRSAVGGAQVAAIAHSVPEAGRRLAAEAGLDVAHTDPYALIEDPGVDAVIVASPGDTHDRLVLACVEAGKPVLCEKPLATTVSAARHVMEAEAALGRRLIQVGFMRRFDPGYAALEGRLSGWAGGRAGGGRAGGVVLSPPPPPPPTPRCPRPPSARR